MKENQERQNLEKLGLLCLALATQLHDNTATMLRKSVVKKIEKKLKESGVKIPQILQEEPEPNEVEKLVKKLLAELEK